MVSLRKWKSEIWEEESSTQGILHLTEPQAKYCFTLSSNKKYLSASVVKAKGKNLPACLHFLLGGRKMLCALIYQLQLHET